MASALAAAAGSMIAVPAAASPAPTPSLAVLSAALPSPIHLGVIKPTFGLLSRAEAYPDLNVCSTATITSDGVLEWNEASYVEPGTKSIGRYADANTRLDGPTQTLVPNGGTESAEVLVGSAPTLIRHADRYCPGKEPLITEAGYRYRQTVGNVTIRGWVGSQSAMTVLNPVTSECLTTTHVDVGKGHLMLTAEVVADSRNGCGNTAGLTAGLRTLLTGAVARLR